ncbi:hypothetical protein GLOIN_2v1785898 [Rhizophagus irregularis DAOM 181602=DAOM 197198]|uniref:Uncharacterized protein n=1 Tax=Rhizophagus irregularis (strain DAOM 181602 / DAOM 197198 / MUCL 43194) TaxID=747089 RepID=A0A2P4P9B0_RHIID|nr:hypothetical protein GLOIN_2v1785898 [Rhizophagus irregularis DAOM 181602=DAOM 197198]PKY33342.1 hypothetical protein RhiirB3_452160 [Rhizophagus irregularis]POG61980.1 hypothetical protein GLOIN_2v1785898 [Rhizophagus irregularis DAOM 181602=DAOM 197198]CAG8713676.1 11005_t:CDS:2 [Rhizophagus irregularis]|eukprot:XP_025168846.1 hypothetical protein GLOIN_2v1785898 [Rhizophagus irregularis DAOM 181602=DAOM 197198]
MDNEQPPTNHERAPSKIPCNNLNTCDFSDTTSNNPSSYASFAIRRRRNQRRLRHITINIMNQSLINYLRLRLVEIAKSANLSNNI